MVIMTNRSTATKEFNSQINDLIMEAFGFSFEKWHDRGFWTDDYERYSILEEGVMLSNISVYKMKMMVNGLPCDYLQLGSVATRHESRGKGFSRKIMEQIFKVYPNTPVFLNGDNDALDYYSKMGFKPLICKQPYVECRLDNTGKMEKLDIDNPMVDFYLKGRSQYSKLLDCTNQYEINWFHVLYLFPDNIYTIPELDVMLIAEQNGSTLTIHDIAAQKPVSFSQLVKCLDFEGTERIHFGFNPDWLDVDYSMGEYEAGDSTLLIKGDLAVDKGFIIPTLITT